MKAKFGKEHSIQLHSSLGENWVTSRTFRVKVGGRKNV